MAQTPASPSRIPTPSGLRRSASVRVKGERPFILYSTSPSPFPSIAEDARKIDTTPSRKDFLRSQSQASGLNTREDDLDSLASFGSNASAFSRVTNRSNCDCEHSLFAKNGTTFSVRSNKYVVHCSGHFCGTNDEYLTPTQRANQKVRRLKTLLQLAREKLVEKDKEIFKLTKEVVELNVYKAKICSPSPASTPSECREALPIDESGLVVDTNTDIDGSFSSPMKSCLDEGQSESPKVSPRGKVSPWDMRENMTATPDYFLSSLTDSGQFDDLASLQSKDSDLASNRSAKKEELIGIYEALLKNCKEGHEGELQALQEANEARVMKMVEAFDMKLKTTEEDFEQKIQKLLVDTEKEKIEIVERFQAQLEKKMLDGFDKKENDCQTDESNINQSFMEEKALYEKSLAAIKEQFQLERQKMENNFDGVMELERKKFEATVSEIQFDYEKRLQAIAEKMSHSEKKYTELLGNHQRALQDISHLEEENAFLKLTIKEQENRQKDLYLRMFLKGQEAANLDTNDEATAVGPSTNKAANTLVPELLVQLKVTQVELENLKDKEYRAQHSDAGGISLISAKEALSLWMLAARKAMYKRLSEAHYQGEASSSSAQPAAPSSALRDSDPEATLQFLKSAVFYFLTDRDNHLQHLRAIENILGFSSSERKDIETRYVN